MNTFSIDNTVLLLVDHQVGTIKIAKNIPEETIIQNTRALARTAASVGISVVLTTSNETHFQGPLFDFLKEILPNEYEKRIKRPGRVNAWEYDDFRNAVLATGRKNIVMAGLTNDVCIVFPSISAVKDGFNVQVVVDAGASPTPLADETALRRMERGAWCSPIQIC